MKTDLALDLHLLNARLDQAADRILRAELNVPYRRFLALFMVEVLGATTQRSLAAHLGVSEPSVSRMCGVLGEAGLLEVLPDPAGGNRRRLELTADGRRLVRHCQDLLAGRLRELTRRAGVRYDDYARQTRELLAGLGE